MFVFLMIVAFAWFMALNISFLLYQQYNVALMAHLRNQYPALYEQNKTRFSFSVLLTDQKLRLLLAEPIAQADPLVIGVLGDLAGLRRRGLAIMSAMTGLLIIVAVLAFR